jgi:hypothetical protein
MLWVILTGVAGGAFIAAGVVLQNREIKENTIDIKTGMESMSKRIEDQERRIIRIETKLGISLMIESTNSVFSGEITGDL